MEQKLKYLISPEFNSFYKFSPKLKVAVLASGEGTNFQVLIDLSKNNKLDIDIKILICNNKNVGCINRASKSNIPYLILDNSDFNSKKDFEQKIIDILKQNHIELIVMAGWMKIVSPYFINNFKNKIINIHPSILPSFKGKSPVKDSLHNDSLITGCSIHFVVPEVDSGKLIIQGALPIELNDNVESLTKKIHKIEHMILPYAVSEAGKIIRKN